MDELEGKSVKNPIHLKEEIIILLSCRAAIKAGERLSEMEMHNLIEELNKAKLMLTCPHGRPTTIRLSWEEIEKKFKRR